MSSEAIEWQEAFCPNCHGDFDIHEDFAHVGDTVHCSHCWQDFSASDDNINTHQADGTCMPMPKRAT